ncbi:MAG: DUF928 domain-containing protein [Spirulina sp.]
MTDTNRLTWICALLAGLLGWSLCAVPIRSQTPAIEFIPPRKGVPNDTGGGTRGYCLGDPEPGDPEPRLPLTPLIPYTTAKGIRGGLTTREYPALWVYIPTTNAEKGELLVLTERTNEEIYHGKISLPSDPGIVKVQLPAEPEGGLRTGQRYLWKFSLICAPLDRGQDSFVRGWIERIAPEPERSPDSLQQAARFARSGLWYDLLAVLMDLRGRQLQDTDFARLWQTLLQSDTVKLSDMSEVEILDCCEIDADE